MPDILEEASEALADGASAIDISGKGQTMAMGDLLAPVGGPVVAGPKPVM